MTLLTFSHRRHVLLAACAVCSLALAGCNAPADNGVEATVANAAANTAQPAVAEGADTNAAATAIPCPIMRDFDWKAAIAAGKDGKPELSVRGTIEVNTGGYQANLSAGLLDKSMPPTQHLTLIVTPPGGPAADVISRLPVEIKLPAQPHYRAIAIDCRGSEIERIETIEGN